MLDLFRDLGFGARTLIRNPGFTLTAIGTLALGIGANAAIFTVTSALLLRPFPYREPQQLVSLAAKNKDTEFPSSLLRYELVRDLSRSFQSIAVWTNDNLNLTGYGDPVQVPVARVSAAFFPMLGVQPQLGRTFTEGEGRPEGKPVVMLSDSIWRSRFRGDRNIIGQAVTLDSTPYTVVGVLPNVPFPFVGPADIWMPRYFELSLMTPQRLRTGVGYLSMLARLRPGTTLPRANAELASLSQRYRELNPSAPDADPATVMSAEPLRDLVVGDLRIKMLLLSGAVGLVLLIACANVASLLLSRGLGRKRELAVRTAMGASRGMIVRQPVTESLLLALVAGIPAVGMSWVATRALSVWAADQLPQGVPIGVDLRVLTFTLTVSVLAGMLFGSIPALQLSRVDLNTSLRDGTRGVSAGRTGAQMRNLLVLGQVALSLLLLIGAGLLLRSFQELLRVFPGFDARNVLTLGLSLPTGKYAKPEQQIAFFDEILRRVSVLPGVRSAATSAALPLSWIRVTPVLPEGQPDVPLAQRPFVDIEAISPQWFQTMRVPLRGGRAFTDSDDANAPKVVVVNESFARRFWPGQSSVGKHVIVGRWTEPAEVVGVAADTRNKGLQQDTQVQLYLSFPQLPWNSMNLLVRTDVPPRSITSAVRAEIAAVDPEQPLSHVKTVDDLLDNARAQPRFVILLTGMFSATALALAAIGLYGVLSYSVAQRRREIGIRMAVGAQSADILRLVLRQGLLLATAGIAVGLMMALSLTRLMSSMLFKVGARDLTTFVLAPLVFLFVALLASYLPARRATKVAPIDELR
jgi:putative ABC transport system permease protein